MKYLRPCGTLRKAYDSIHISMIFFDQQNLLYQYLAFLRLEADIPNNDPGALQDHCVILYCKISGKTSPMRQ